MGRSERREMPSVLVGTLRVENRGIEGELACGLRAGGYDVDIVPEFIPASENLPPMPGGSTIKIYRKVDDPCTN